jgi:hypothetical protein
MQENAGAVYKANLARRRLAPVWMEEELQEDEERPRGTTEQQQQQPPDNVTIHYAVTDMGLLSAELEKDSHRATVSFLATHGNQTETASTAGMDRNHTTTSTTMVWEVTFTAPHRRHLRHSMTQQSLQTIADNLASYLATPYCYKRTTILHVGSSLFLSASNATERKNHHHSSILTDIFQGWVNFVCDQGGGLPLFSFRLDEARRMYVPPFLVERLVSDVPDDTTEDGTGEIRYTVDNPGLFTYPVHSHAGRIRFVPVSNTTHKTTSIEGRDVEMIWEVQVRPFRGLESFVKLWTATSITILARNFQNHLQEPGATVSVAPPRGKGDPFATIPKDTWLGGVLAAHLMDQRSTVEQTISMFQPGTWGRATDGPGESEEWSSGFLSE